MPFRRLLAQSRRAAEVSALVAICCLLALSLDHLLKPVVGQHVSASFFFLPSGVNIIAMLAFGPMASIGVGSSVLLWSLLVRGMSATQSIGLTLTTMLVCVLALWVHGRLRELRIIAERPPPAHSLTISLADAVMFPVIYGLINSVTKELLLSPLLYNKPPSIADMSLKFTGDVLGGITVLVVANLAISAWISWRKWRAQGE